jgi:hypothetical protein
VFLEGCTMKRYASRSRLFACLIAGAIGAVGAIGVVADARIHLAYAQDIADFHDSLEPYGRWIEHPRWGEVWVPANVPDDWAPYRYGHWVYTDDWGWYWVSDEDFGWITYHYGRWIPDPDVGWIWIPGTDWSPAWVSWRRGDEAMGWMPMPPDDVVDEYEARPECWVFVRPADILAPRIAVVAFPRVQVNVFVQQTVVVNRTIFAQQGGGRIIANPGIPPSFIAASIGHPIQTVSIQPHVLRGTIGVAGAIVGGVAVGVAIHESIHVQAAVIQPAATVPPPVRFNPQHVDLGPDAPKSLREWHQGPGVSGGQTQQQGTTQHQPGGQPPGGHPGSNPGLGPQGNIEPQHHQENLRPAPGNPGNPPQPQQGNLQQQRPQEQEHHEEHHAPPPPAPTVNRAPPPPPVANRAPPPQANRPSPPPQKPQQQAGKKCEKVNGKEVCK